jgi:hypothetical protein
MLAAAQPGVGAVFHGLQYQVRGRDRQARRAVIRRGVR